jgi:hypothetical protein
MSRAFFKKYIQIIMEANSYRSLSDAGPDYSPGDTQIYFVKKEYSNQFKQGYQSLSNNASSLPKDISQTHTLVGTLAETDPNKIYSMMQAVIWNPSGDGDELIANLNLNHSDMSTGDIMVIGNRIIMVDTKGFVDLATGEEV